MALQIQPTPRVGTEKTRSPQGRIRADALPFAQDFVSPGWARRFFDQWQAALRWQRLKPFEKFARMAESHWDGIALYCQAENKVALGFVEGFNNKVRVIQRRAYGLRDEEHPPPQDLDLHAPGNLTDRPKNDAHAWEKSHYRKGT